MALVWRESLRWLPVRMLSKVGRQHAWRVSGDSRHCQEVWAQCLARSTFFFFFGEWEFTGSSLQTWHHPLEVGMYRNRALKGACVRLWRCTSVNETEKVSYQRSPELVFPFFFLITLFWCNQISNMFKLMSSDMCEQLISSLQSD